MIATPRLQGSEIGALLGRVCDVGSRFVGSPGDRAIRRLLVSEFTAAGLQSVREEPVPVLVYEPIAARCMLDDREAFRAVGLQFSADGAVEGEGVDLGTAASVSELRAALTRAPSVAGRIAVVRTHFPFLLTELLIQHGVRGIVVVSDAHGDWIGHYTAVMYPCGESPTFAGRPIAVPGVVIGLRDGEHLAQALSGAPGRRLAIEHRARYEPGLSANVVGLAPGADPGTGCEHVLIGAHHDTQLEGAGACDNASGIATLIAAVRQWGRSPTARTVVFAAFADEEHGLYGSLAYCRRHVRALRSCVAMLNLDALAWREDASLRLEADPALRDFADTCLRTAGWDAQLADPSAIPGADHVPFVDAGVPAAWLWRFPPQHPYFHTAGDVIELLDLDLVADTAMAALHLGRCIADQPELGFGRSRPSRRWMSIDAPGDD